MGFYTVTSFLQPCDIKRLGTASIQIYDQCRKFMTYLYNEYGCNELYYKLNKAKWIIRNCTHQILSDCINKKLTLVKIIFNQPIETLAKCVQLRQITFNWCFNQSIEALSQCTLLKSIQFCGLLNFYVIRGIYMRYICF